MYLGLNCRHCMGPGWSAFMTATLTPVSVFQQWIRPSVDPVVNTTELQIMNAFTVKSLYQYMKFMMAHWLELIIITSVTHKNLPPLIFFKNLPKAWTLIISQISIIHEKLIMLNFNKTTMIFFPFFPKKYKHTIECLYDGRFYHFLLKINDMYGFVHVYTSCWNSPINDMFI